MKPKQCSDAESHQGYTLSTEEYIQDMHSSTLNYGQVNLSLILQGLNILWGHNQAYWTLQNEQVQWEISFVSRRAMKETLECLPFMYKTGNCFVLKLVCQQRIEIVSLFFLCVCVLILIALSWLHLSGRYFPEGGYRKKLVQIESGYRRCSLENHLPQHSLST